MTNLSTAARASAAAMIAAMLLAMGATAQKAASGPSVLAVSKPPELSVVPTLQMQVTFPLTQEQTYALKTAKERIKPGIYLFVPLSVPACIGVNPGASDKLAVMNCDSASSLVQSQTTRIEFAVLPGSHGFTIRNTDPAPGPVQDRLAMCATLQRGAVVGPRAITWALCSFSGRNVRDWSDAGAQDQLFLFTPTGTDDTFAITPAAEKRDCWALRGASVDIGTDVISWRCNRQADQRFQLRWVRELPVGVEEPLLKKRGWLLASDGYQRAATLYGVDMPGGNYTEFETIGDLGEYCAYACINNGAQCKGFTWTAPGFDRPKPMCQLKSSLSTPINRGDDAFEKIISAIVRP